jgi:hypothetical protein
MKKIIKIIFALLAIVFILIQFIRPLRINPVSDKTRDITATINIPSNVKQILDRSCYDCHSNDTRWPWYSYIAPVSWLLAQDVNNGREKINYSEWGNYSLTDQVSNFDDIAKMVKNGEMPLPKYLFLHSDAKLTDADKDLLIKWAKAMSDSLMSN